MGDVNSYWEKLESLLTVDEVAEWIVHAGQLPKQVGRYVDYFTNRSHQDFTEQLSKNCP